jgi:hypothetical protein
MRKWGEERGLTILVNSNDVDEKEEEGMSHLHLSPANQFQFKTFS